MDEAKNGLVLNLFILSALLVSVGMYGFGRAAYRLGFERGRSLGELTWNQLAVAQQKQYRKMIEDPLHLEIDHVPVEFLALREGICRSIWVEGKTVLSSEIIECPVGELLDYVQGKSKRSKDG